MQSDTVIQWPGPVNCRAAPHSAQVTGGRDSEAASSNSVRNTQPTAEVPGVLRHLPCVFSKCARCSRVSSNEVAVSQVRFLRYLLCGRLLRAAQCWVCGYGGGVVVGMLIPAGRKSGRAVRVCVRIWDESLPHYSCEFMFADDPPRLEHEHGGHDGHGDWSASS